MTKTSPAAREALGLRVYVVGGGFQYIKMFFDAGFLGARSVEDADIVCFTGGEDVDPALYQEQPLAKTAYNRPRDDAEIDVFIEALSANKPMVGICRGSQFLNVMNGGKLWQHVNNHCGNHSVFLPATGEVVVGMTSTHHQMMRPPKDAIILALASCATEKLAFGEELTRDKPEQDDVEAVWFPDTLCLCFQPHPEFTEGPCRDLFLDFVDDYVCTAC